MEVLGIAHIIFIFSSNGMVKSKVAYIVNLMSTIPITCNDQIILLFYTPKKLKLVGMNS